MNDETMKSTTESDLEYARRLWEKDPTVADWPLNISGMCSGYKPQWKYPDEPEWRDVKSIRVPDGTGGVKYPFHNGGVLQTIGLSGEAQSWALAWGVAADAEAKGEHIEVRIDKYDVEYEIKAKRTPE